MSKDQWIADLERILEDYAAEDIDKETAEGLLTGLGLDPGEIATNLRESIS